MAAIDSFILERDKEFLKFIKGRFHFYHLSNVFFRDLHYGVMAFLEQHSVKHSYPSAEDATRSIIAHFEGQSIFRRIDERTWLLHYPEFKAVSSKPAPARPAAPAKPAGAAPAAKPATPPVKPAAAAPAAKPAAPPVKPAAAASTPQPTPDQGATPSAG